LLVWTCRSPKAGCANCHAPPAFGDYDFHNAGVDAVREAKLAAQDQKDLVAFLKALFGKYPTSKPPKLPQ